MKYLVFSDLHGSYSALKEVEKKYLLHNCDKLICLGDLLYHGPRNDLPNDYDPKQVFSLLQSYLDKFIWIQGNCDAEVDEMVMNKKFVKRKIIKINKQKFILAHGHHLSRFDIDNKIEKGTIVLYGHYHVFDISNINDVIYINIGSTSIPKDNIRQYALLDNKSIKVFNLDTDDLIGEYRYE